MQLVLDTKGITVKKRNNCFHLKTDKHERLISPVRVSSIAVTSYCMLSTSAIMLAVQNGIPIYFLDALGKVKGRLWTGSFGGLSTLRRQQVYFRQKAQALDWVVGLFCTKIGRQNENLKHLKSYSKANRRLLEKTSEQLEKAIEQLKNLNGKALSEVSGSVLGIEGSAARAYWQAVAACMPTEFAFVERSRQPAHDRFNVLLNYMYGMLYGLVETALFAAGLDPYLGIFHADQHAKPTLSYDLIEPFRPWVDALLIEGSRKWEIKADFFEQTKGGLTLTKMGKAFIIPIFNNYWAERLLHNHKNVMRKAHIAREVYMLVDYLKEPIENL